MKSRHSTYEVLYYKTSTSSIVVRVDFFMHGEQTPFARVRSILKPLFSCLLSEIPTPVPRERESTISKVLSYQSDSLGFRLLNFPRASQDPATGRGVHSKLYFAPCMLLDHPEVLLSTWDHTPLRNKYISSLTTERQFVSHNLLLQIPPPDTHDWDAQPSLESYFSVTWRGSKINPTPWAAVWPITHRTGSSSISKTSQMTS